MWVTASAPQTWRYEIEVAASQCSVYVGLRPPSDTKSRAYLSAAAAPEMTITDCFVEPKEVVLLGTASA